MMNPMLLVLLAFAATGSAKLSESHPITSGPEGIDAGERVHDERQRQGLPVDCMWFCWNFDCPDWFWFECLDIVDPPWEEEDPDDPDDDIEAPIPPRDTNPGDPSLPDEVLDPCDLQLGDNDLCRDPAAELSTIRGEIDIDELFQVIFDTYPRVRERSHFDQRRQEGQE